ncbi:Hypothetical predicted protein [Pelobates cultripes]|uniref:Uncharacterized protein n=1 Tax=Pelobates cultripes TaxID=61616 RepID=A0AAD1WUN2_PELCU|nr:Hypothetical predicted protein [Pelobates cultripes]
MVRNKKLLTQGGPPHCQTGTMDDFVSTPGTLGGSGPADNMALGSPDLESAGSSTADGVWEDTLALIRQELAAISGQKKTDTSSLIQDLRTAVRKEIAALCTDLSAVEERVEALETEAQTSRRQHQAVEIATTRQRNLLLSLRHQVEDLEYRSRRHNIRIRGLPEPDATPVPDTITALFQEILGRDCPPEIQFDRVHRALGPPRPDD